MFNKFHKQIIIQSYSFINIKKYEIIIQIKYCYFFNLFFHMLTFYRLIERAIIETVWRCPLIALLKAKIFSTGATPA